jgi:hypothetical protein
MEGSAKPIIARNYGYNESDARTHRTPKALRAKFMETPLTVSRQLSECGGVLAPLLIVCVKPVLRMPVDVRLGPGGVPGA